MSNRGDRKVNSTETNDSKSTWPSWFIEPTHPVEREILKRILQRNNQLSEIHFTVNMMQINYLVFRRNYEELDLLLIEFNKPMVFKEIALQTDMGIEISQDIIVEFTRFLLNFLASAKMLVEVTRRWVRQQFADSKFLDTYQDEVSTRFENNVQAQFLEDLRNFTLHRTLPLSLPELRMQKVNESRLKSSVGIVLLKDYLLEWDNWSELARIQIGMAFEGEVDIMQICEQYFNNVTEFNIWLFWQVRTLFSEEIEQVNSVIENLRNR
jgi:hypothetical protein